MARVLLLLLLIIVGCQGVLDGAPEPVRAALGPLAADGFACTGPKTDQSGYGQWACHRVDAGVVYDVLVDANTAGVKNVLGQIDQSAATRDPARTTEFFDGLASIPLGAPTDEIRGWVADNAGRSVQAQLGQVFATIEAAGAQDRLVLFVSD